jgi:hypothetical protein
MVWLGPSARAVAVSQSLPTAYTMLPAGADMVTDGAPLPLAVAAVTVASTPVNATTVIMPCHQPFALVAVTWNPALVRAAHAVQISESPQEALARAARVQLYPPPVTELMDCDRLVPGPSVATKTTSSWFGCAVASVGDTIDDEAVD